MLFPTKTLSFHSAKICLVRILFWFKKEKQCAEKGREFWSSID